MRTFRWVWIADSEDKKWYVDLIMIMRIRTCCLHVVEMYLLKARRSGCPNQERVSSQSLCKHAQTENRSRVRLFSMSPSALCNEFVRKTYGVRLFFIFVKASSLLFRSQEKHLFDRCEVSGNAQT